MGTQSHLPMIRLTELQTIGCHICPDVGEKCCGAGKDLAECLGVLQVPIGDDDGFIQIFRFPWSCDLRGDMKRRIFPLSHGAFRPEGSEAQSVVRSCLPTGGFICACTLDAARHAARDVSLYKGSQSRPSNVV